MNKGIIFFIGLLVGILMCVLLFYLNVKMPKNIFSTEKEKVTARVDTVYLETPKKQQKVNMEKKTGEILDTDTVNGKQTEGDISIYETEFSFEGEKQDEVFSDQLLHTKTVKVKILNPEKQDVKASEEFFQSFEIQHWSTPIKNKITYTRNQNMVKIKGMDIDNVSIVLWNETYFLEVGNRHYAIPETSNFEKLNPVQIPQ